MEVDVRSSPSELAKQRVQKELEELAVKSDALNNFIATEGFLKLSEEQRDLLSIQNSTMFAYRGILERRLKIWDKE